MKRLINVEATSYCLANCRMCPRHLITDYGYMSLDTAKFLSNKIDKLDDIWEVSVAGRGEPTIHPQFSEFMKIVKSAGKDVSVVTTAAHINDDILSTFNNYVDKVRLSISSINDDVFKKIHIGLNYSNVWHNIEKIISNVPSEKIIIHLVGGEIIYEGISETIDYFRKKGIDNVYIFPLWNRAGANKENSTETEKRLKIIDKFDLKPSESEYFPPKSELKKIKVEGCLIGDLSLSINFKGDVTACFQDFGYSEIVGNIYANDFEDLILKRQKKLGRMRMCGKCNSNLVAINR